MPFYLVQRILLELFPTCIRNRAVGFCALIGKLGGITAMMLDLLNDVWLPVPVLVRGVSATLARAFAPAFHETAGEKLPDTVE